MITHETYFISKHGRFTSIDPLTASANVKDPQTFNRYTYALNSPYKFTDPLGLISEYAGSACGSRCANSDSGLSISGNDSKDVSGNFAKEQQAAQPESPPVVSLTVNDVTYYGTPVSNTTLENGTSTINLTYDWWTTASNDTGSARAFVSDEVRNILNDSISRIATNSVNAFVAHDNFTTIGKVTLSLEGSVSLGKAKNSIVPTGGEGSIGLTFEINNSEEITNKTKAANDQIQLQLVADLNKVQMKTAWSGGSPVVLGEEKIGKDQITLSAKFAQLARDVGNSEAQNHYNNTFQGKKIPVTRGF